MVHSEISLGLAWNPESGRIGRPVSYARDRHITLFGPARSGKGVSLEIPNLLRLSGLSIISIDPNGQNAAVTARWRRTVGNVIMLNPFNLLGLGSTGFNPLAALNPDSNHFFEQAETIAEALIRVERNAPSPFSEGARDLVLALVMWERIEAQRERRAPSLFNVHRMLCEAEETDPVGRSAAGLLKIAADIVAFGGAQITSLVERFVRQHGQSKSVASIIATAVAQTEWLLSSHMCDDLEKDGIDFARLKDEPTTVYVILPAAQLQTFSAWLRLIVVCALNALYQRADNGGLRTLFMLPEFAQLGHLKPIEAAFAQGASYGVQLFPMLQDISQLRALYGRDPANSCLGMSGATFAFTPKDHATTEWMSKRSSKIGELAVCTTDDPFHGVVWFAEQSAAQPVYAPPYWKIAELAARYDPDPYHPFLVEPESLSTIEDALQVLSQPEDTKSFLTTMLSENEYNRLQKRWQAYQLRRAGMSLNEIVRTAHVAAATATRAAALRRSTHAEVLDIAIARGVDRIRKQNAAAQAVLEELETLRGETSKLFGFNIDIDIDTRKTQNKYVNRRAIIKAAADLFGLSVEGLERAAAQAARETTSRAVAGPRARTPSLPQAGGAEAIIEEATAATKEAATTTPRLKWGKDRDPDEDPAHFAARAYATEIAGGTFDKSLIRRDDKALYQRFFRDKAWGELEAVIASPVLTKSQRYTELIETGAAGDPAAAEAHRLVTAVNQRKARKGKPRAAPGPR